ncbi:restriction endonuclease subunit S domain-containing protein [Rhodoferax antarcticus]|uniref:restriction endonuclease subunit S n=1 Tax=Rhodoferax antarcticus TaxID=81479 RepID=UPI0022249643|nr:restriction endonuclease subunit S [Rhodoferax antarcticus]MCW2312732.1 type I restriction enzyme S subunit [Rhodoferax antarcticus]
MIADLKPYSEYKDSGMTWLDRVPKHWVLRPAFGAFMPNKERNFSMREKTVLSLSYGRIVIKPPEKLHGLVPESFETYQIVNPGDIVVRTTDLQNDHTSLRMGMVRNRGIITSAYLALHPKPGVSPDFGFQLLHVWDTSKAIYGYGSGLRQSLGFSDFKRMPVVVPPPDEQAAIVKFLDWANARLERTIRAKRRVIALLTEQKQAIIHRAVTRGLDPSVPLKPSGIAWLGDIPAHWEVRPLKAVCKIQSGTTLGKDYGAQQTYEFPYLRVANVQAGYVKLSVVKKVAVSMSEAQRRTLENGDVLMTEGGDLDKLGRGCVWEAQISPCLHQNHVFAVRPDKSKLDPQFLSALMGTPYARAYFQMTAKQTTNLAATNKTKIGQLSVLLPSVVQQREILVALGRETKPVDTAISRLNREIDLLCEYRTRLVADIVTGKLDVREAAAHLPQDDVQAALEPDALDPDEATDADADAELEE